MNLKYHKLYISSRNNSPWELELRNNNSSYTFKSDRNQYIYIATFFLAVGYIILNHHIGYNVMFMSIRRGKRSRKQTAIGAQYTKKMKRNTNNKSNDITVDVAKDNDEKTRYNYSFS